MTSRRIRAMVAVAAASMLASACRASGSTPSELTIGGAWARPTPPGATNGVVYLTITADTDDTITGASIPASVAATATLHTASGGEGEHAHHGADATGDIVSMPGTEAIELTAGEPFVFAPDSNHIMLTDLTTPLKTGSQFTLTLELASGRTPTVNVTVADNPPDT